MKNRVEVSAYQDTCFPSNEGMLRVFKEKVKILAGEVFEGYAVKNLLYRAISVRNTSYPLSFFAWNCLSRRNLVSFPHKSDPLVFFHGDYGEEVITAGYLAGSLYGVILNILFLPICLMSPVKNVERRFL